jgi:tetratricopeptide (TPR) repeat protein
MRTHPLKLAALRSLALGLTLLSACVAHDKAGDKFAAAGDWKNAYAHYKQAAADKPQDPVIRQKLEDARTRALTDASAQANACASQRQWDCALQESDFVVSVDPSRADIAELRSRAATEVALSRLAQVQEEVVRGRLQMAAGLIQQARQLSNDPAVESAARTATQIYASGVADESDRLRAQRRYPEAISLLQAGAQLDPSLRRRLDDTAREYDGWKSSEHDRFLADGEGHLSAGRWAEAQKSLQSAQQMRADERAKALEAYAREMLAGDEAVKRADWTAATRAYRAAAGLRVDRGFAEEMAAKVTVKPYSVSIRTVVVTPLRPNRQPWVGQPERRLERIQEILADRWTDPLAGKVLLALNEVPAANRPDLVVEVTLPNGTRLETKPERAIYATPRAVFVVAANGFDKGKVIFRVLHRLPGGQPEDIGYADATLGELVSKRTLILQDRAVGAIELTIDPAEGSRPGSFTGLTPVAPVAPPAGAAAPPPAPAPGKPAAPPQETKPAPSGPQKGSFSPRR